MRSLGVNRITRWVVGAIVVGIVTSNATAQYAEAEPLRITQAEFDQHVEALDLSLAQAAAAKQAFDKLTAEFDAARDCSRRVQDWVYSNDAQWYRAMDEEANIAMACEQRLSAEQWERGARELEQRYFDDLRRVAIGWESVVDELQRQRLRTRMLRPDVLHEPPGCHADLMAVMLQVDPQATERPALADILQTYAAELHQRLTAFDQLRIGYRRVRNDAMERGRAVQAAGGDGAADFQDAADCIVAFLVGSAEIRQLHRELYDRLVVVLDEPEREQFIRGAHPALFPYLDTPDDLPAMLADSQRSKDLSPDQRDALERIDAMYWSERIAAARKLDGLQKQVRDPAAVARDLRGWAEAMTRKEQYRSESTETEQAFDEQMDRWRERCKGFASDVHDVIPPSAEPVRKETP